MYQFFFLPTGDLETNSKVCQMILQKIIEDPQSGSCLNLSYADVAGPVANFSPTGSPYATKPGQYSKFTLKFGMSKYFYNVHMCVYVCLCLFSFIGGK